jgi:hypothetical protein
MLTKRILIPYFTIIILLLIALIYKDIYIDIDNTNVKEITIDKAINNISIIKNKPSITTLNRNSIINTNKLKTVKTPIKSKIIRSEIKSLTPEKSPEISIISVNPRTTIPTIEPTIMPTLQPTLRPLPTISN